MRRKNHNKAAFRYYLLENYWFSYFECIRSNLPLSNFSCREFLNFFSQLNMKVDVMKVCRQVIMHTM
jgi:hypothetical protein